jgi:hypothetical protein
MDQEGPKTALLVVRTDLQVALRGAVSLCASATTSESERRDDLLHDKQRIVLSSFQHTGNSRPKSSRPTFRAGCVT